MGRAAPESDSWAIEWGVSGRALPGQAASGDAHVVTQVAVGALVAAIDGLGHGVEAASAAEIATATLANHASEPVTELIRLCHDAMRRSRGAAVSIAQFDATQHTMTWIGVGNVEGVLVRAASDATRARETLLLRGGVVGYQLPPLRSATLSVEPGDMLVFATDGVSTKFRHELMPDLPSEDVAADIMGRHAKEIDDALVVVARYRGGSS